MEKEEYKYYSTQRPVDIGTFPKEPNNPLRFENFDKRENVERGRFRAWGYLIYDAPLTDKQQSDYELRAAPDNPDLIKFYEQAQVVGKWETAHRVKDIKRLTWWYPDFGEYIAKEFVTLQKMETAYNEITEAKNRAASKPIAEQLAEAEKQIKQGETPATDKPPKREER